MAFEIRAARIKISACVQKYRHLSTETSESCDHRLPIYQRVRSDFLNEFLGRKQHESCRYSSSVSWVDSTSEKDFTQTATGSHLTSQTNRSSNHSNKSLPINTTLSQLWRNSTVSNPLNMTEVLTLLGKAHSNVQQSHLHSVDPIIKIVSQSPDDIILSNKKLPNSSMLADDNQHAIISRENCNVTVISEFLPLPQPLGSLAKLEFVPLSAFEKNMMMNCSKIESSTPSNQPTNDGGGKPSEEQLEGAFSRLGKSLPNLFTKPLDYSLYHQQIIFQNNIRGVTTRGIQAYVSQIALLRIIGHFRFAYVTLDILKITKHPEDGTVRVRWRICGMPGYKMFFKFWKYKWLNYKETVSEEGRIWYDGFSTFYIGSDGLVYKHLCDKMMPDDSKETIKQTNSLGVKLALITGLIPRMSLDDLACVVAQSDMEEISKILPDL